MMSSLNVCFFFVMCLRGVSDRDYAQMLIQPITLQYCCQQQQASIAASSNKHALILGPTHINVAAGYEGASRP